MSILILFPTSVLIFENHCHAHCVCAEKTTTECVFWYRCLFSSLKCRPLKTRLLIYVFFVPWQISPTTLIGCLNQENQALLINIYSLNICVGSYVNIIVIIEYIKK